MGWIFQLLSEKCSFFAETTKTNLELIEEIPLSFLLQ